MNPDAFLYSLADGEETGAWCCLWTSVSRDTDDIEWRNMRRGQ